MTGLDLFRSHIANLRSLGLASDGDVGRVNQMVQDIVFDGQNIIQYASSLASFYDDIYKGVKTGQFEASADTIRTFSLFHSARLPKFLFGLTSRVFDCNGVLLQDFHKVSFRTLLTTLALTRRIYSRETTEHTRKAGIESYYASQAPRVGPTTHFNSIKSLFWKVLLKEWDSHITWGDLGPGVLIDKEFPFERHLALPSLFGVPRSAALFLEKALRRRFKNNAVIVPGYSVDGLIAWLKTEECHKHPFVFAYATKTQPSRLTTVEKDCRKDRPITVTYGWKAILGACIRETGKKLLRFFGLKDTLNVDNQFLSHQFLWKHYRDAFTADKADGSGNYAEDDLERTLPYQGIAELQSLSVTHLVTVKLEDGSSEIIEARTLQMGDSSCNFWLTTSEFFLQVASMLENDFAKPHLFTSGLNVVHQAIKLDQFSEEDMRGYIVEAGKLCQVVGDDFIGLAPYWESYKKICLENNIRLNLKKTSSPTDNLKESCGLWIRVDVDGYEDLYPHRAPKEIPGHRDQTLANCVSYLHKISGDEDMCRLMTLTLSSHLGPYGTKLLSLSRNLDEIGNPYGVGIPDQIVPRNDADAAPVCDNLKAFFHLSEDLFPLMSKEESRSKVQRYRRNVSTRYVEIAPLSPDERVRSSSVYWIPPVSWFMRRLIKTVAFAGMN